MKIGPALTALMYLFEDLLQTSMRQDFHQLCAMPLISRALRRLVIDWPMHPLHAFSSLRNPKLSYCITEHHLTAFRDIGDLIYKHEQNLKIGGEMCVYSFGFVEMMSKLRMEIWVPDHKILLSNFASGENAVPLHDYCLRLMRPHQFFAQHYFAGKEP
jgi:hypothetical protein